MNKTLLVFVIYDSIENSVFSSQIMQLIRKKIKQERHVLLISFEKKTPSSQLINQKIPKISGLHESIFLKKLPFLGKMSMIPAIYQLKKVLKTLKNYEIIARGPHAGFICTKAIDFNQCSSFTIQARGLIAEEYRYAKQEEKNIIKRIIQKVRYIQFKNLEKTVYGKTHLLPHASIEAVSPALKNYIANNFAADKNNITIATEDIPQAHKSSKINQWHKIIRKKYNIPQKTTVYCYNGSIKPWQCPDMVVDFFVKQMEKNAHNFLLVLTQNKKQFEHLIQEKNIPQKNYLVTCVDHNDIYQYLAACDYGIIFRKKSMVNWVSRPTKALEYKAVGLEIIHNNTVDWIVHNS